jgi:hypothetical protein
MYRNQPNSPRGHLVWILIIALGVFLGLGMWGITNGFIAAWQRHREVIERRALEEASRDREVRLSRELEQMRRESERLAAERDEADHFWDKLLKEVRQGRDGPYLERLERRTEYQERLKRLGRDRCQTEELAAISSLLRAIQNDRAQKRRFGITEQSDEYAWRLDLEVRESILKNAPGNDTREMK